MPSQPNQPVTKLLVIGAENNWKLRGDMQPIATTVDGLMRWREFDACAVSAGRSAAVRSSPDA